MNWITFIPMILEIIQKCMDQQGEDQVFKTLKKRRGLCRLVVRRIGRDEGLKGRELATFVKDAMDDLKEATDDDLRELFV